MDAAHLDSIPLFASLSAKERKQLAMWMDVVDLPAGRQLTAQGVLAYEFLVIKEGSAEVTQEGRHLRELGPGDYLGEIGLLDAERRRSATVVTTSPTTALVLAGPQFRAMMQEMPAVAQQVRETIRARLDTADR